MPAFSATGNHPEPLSLKNNLVKTKNSDMNKKIIAGTMLMIVLLVYISSCYNNKEDIAQLPRVSFLGDVVPIVTSGACGCHNNVNANSSTSSNAVPFSKPDTVINGTIIKRVETGAIVARVDTMAKWAAGEIPHPGGGIIDFTPNQRKIILAWKNQGQPYDGGAVVCDLTGTIKHTTHIDPIYKSTCKSPGCHGVGTRGPNLDYNKMVADKNILTVMMNSGGSSGHPGGNIGMTSCTINTFKTWIEQGMIQ
jgi:hypothetical protein